MLFQACSQILILQSLGEDLDLEFQGFALTVIVNLPGSAEPDLSLPSIFRSIHNYRTLNIYI